MSSGEIKECPICYNKAEFISTSGADYSHIICSRCGEFKIEGRTEAHFINSEDYSKTIRNNISCWIFENQKVMLTSKDIDFLINLKSPSIEERANKLLIYISEKFPLLGQEIDFQDEKLTGLVSTRNRDIDMFYRIVESSVNQNYTNSMLTISWSQNVEEFCFLLFNYLKNYDFVECTDTDNILLSPNGWKRIEDLRKINPKSAIGFVAMWFDISTSDVYLKSIEPAISSAGYKPLRIDRHEHNNKIDDEIIAGIRRSKFVICDFTGQRGGVYFEAGYALGLGLQVIWICKEGELKNIHFDNRQYNFLEWNENKLEEFKKALQNRIEATIGRPNQS